MQLVGLKPGPISLYYDCIPVKHGQNGDVKPIFRLGRVPNPPWRKLTKLACKRVMLMTLLGASRSVGYFLEFGYYY
jgi:hypothetical protein